jgi:Na+/H+-dicarboxylate symporter
MLAAGTNNSNKNSARLAVYIVIAMLLGTLFGYLVNQHIVQIDIATISLPSDLFLRAIKMIIAPLVFATLTVGIAQMGGGANVGRVGLKALVWFFTASIVSLFLGLLFATLFHPGLDSGFHTLTAQQIAAGQSRLEELSKGAHDSGFVAFVRSQIIPTSVIDAAANNRLLQIVFFSVLFGVALGSMREKAQGMISIIQQLSDAMIKITNIVMMAAPIAVFAAIASAVADKGLGLLITYGKFIGSFYVALIFLWTVLIFAGYIFLGKRIGELMRGIREAFFLAFATASSEAAFPKILEALDKFGVNRKISSFVMPLGYSFNLDGGMMYCTFAILFIAQFYKIELSVGTQISMLFTLMLTSKGVAGVPAASLIVIAGTLAQFNLPIEGILLILGVDRFLDMGRSATNAVGNSIASAVVAKWEGELRSPDQM